MPMESGKKMQELLRVLFLEGGAHTRPSLAARLGLSKSSLDNAREEMRELYSATMADVLEEDRKKYKVSRFRYEQFRRCRNFLAQLYRTRTVRQQEQTRLLAIIRALAEKPQTRGELRERIDKEDSGNEASCDEKTLSSYLKQLSAAGIILRLGKGSNVIYDLQAGLFRPENSSDKLKTEEITDLRDFVEYAAAVSVLSVPGHMLLDTLLQYLSCVEGVEHSPIFSFKYNLIGRVLDEYLAVDLMEAIKNRRKIRLEYLSRSTEYRYEAAPTPRFRCKAERKVDIALIPLRVVYDHQYGRWYLLAYDEAGLKHATFRMENIQAVVDKGETVDDALMEGLLKQADAKQAQSWVVQDPSQQVRVQLRFCLRPTGKEENFLRRRVQREACWGRISEEQGSTFLFEIDVNGYFEIKPWIRSFGSSVEVLAPEELRLEIAEEWRKIGAAYETV